MVDKPKDVTSGVPRRKRMDGTYTDESLSAGALNKIAATIANSVDPDIIGEKVQEGVEKGIREGMMREAIAMMREAHQARDRGEIPTRKGPMFPQPKLLSRDDIKGLAKEKTQTFVRAGVDDTQATMEGAERILRSAFAGSPFESINKNLSKQNSKLQKVQDHTFDELAISEANVAVNEEMRHAITDRLIPVETESNDSLKKLLTIERKSLAKLADIAIALAPNNLPKDQTPDNSVSNMDYRSRSIDTRFESSRTERKSLRERAVDISKGVGASLIGLGGMFKNVTNAIDKVNEQSIELTRQGEKLTFFQGISTFFAALGVIGSTGAALGATGAGLAASFIPLTVGIAAIAGVFLYLGTNLDRAKALTEGLLESSVSFGRMIGSISRFIALATVPLMGALTFFGMLITETLIPIFTTLIPAIFDGIATYFDDLSINLGAMIQGMLSGDWSQVFNNLQGFLINATGGLVTLAGKVLWAAFLTLDDVLTGIIDAVMKVFGIDDFTAKVTQWFTDTGTNIVNGVVDFINGMGSQITKEFGMFVNAHAAVVGVIGDLWNSVTSSVSNWFSKLGTDTTGALTDLFAVSPLGLVVKAVQGIIDFIIGIIPTSEDLMKWLKGSIKDNMLIPGPVKDWLLGMMEPTMVPISQVEALNIPVSPLISTEVKDTYTNMAGKSGLQSAMSGQVPIVVQNNNNVVQNNTNNSGGNDGGSPMVRPPSTSPGLQVWDNMLFGNGGQLPK